MSPLRLPVPWRPILRRTSKAVNAIRLNAPHNRSMIIGPGGMRGRARGTRPDTAVDCAVVLTVIADVTAPPLGVTAEGLKIHDAPCGKRLLGQLRTTGWLKPLTGVTVTV